MSKELVISASPHETRVAVLEDGQLCEIYIEREKEFALVGSIYKGRVTRVLPGMQSAFVDIGLDSDAFLYVGDFFENLEDYDHVVTTVEGKVEKMEQQGGALFAPPSGEEPPAEQPPAPLASAAEDAGDTSPDDAIGNREFSAPQSAPSTSGTPRTFDRQNRPPRSFGQGQGPGQGQGSGQGQGRSQGFGRGDQGRNRGGGGGGRWGRGRGRGNDRRPSSRDLPQSKYASPRPYTPRPFVPPADEPPTDYEPIILPGESLAKYKDRIPGSAAAGAPAAPPAESARSASEALPERLSESLPSSLYSAPFASPVEPSAMEPISEAPGIAKKESRAVTEASEKPLSAIPPVASATETSVEPSPELDAEAFSDFQPLPEEPPRGILDPKHHVSSSAASAAPHPELSDEEMTSLSEQLAEARQEEAAADVAAADEESAEHAEDDETDAHDEVAHEDAALEDAAIGEAESEGLPAMEQAAEAAGDASEAEPGEFHGETESPQPSQSQPATARVFDPQRARFQRPMRRGGRGDRGRSGGNRPHARNQDHRHQAPRRPQLISEVLKAGQEIIVQIAKEPLGKKGARITSHVALPGRFLVYMPTVNHIGVSRRIASADERARLRHLVTDAKGTFPGGFIVRTAADGAPDEEIRADVEFLGRTWEKIRTQSEPRKSPALMHRDLNLVERILRDYLSNDYTAIWIDNEDEFSKVIEFVGRFQPKLVSRVKLYTKPAPIFEEFGIQQELDHALRPKVWLKSGGYIVINHTEALVAIDVNTGKYVGRGGTRLEDTIVKTNLEAVKEIIRQIRLRDLGGIIILDFIDMEERRNREKVMAALEAALRSDRAPSKALPFNEFGLVAVTRKRTKQALERVLCQPCPHCTGSGMVKSIPTICYEIQAEARKMAADLDSGSITLRVHPEIGKALKTREAALIDELEQMTRKSIIIQSDPTLHWEQYDIY
jgi:Rne/Rng family ribonuclease